MKKYFLILIFSITNWLYAQQNTRFMVVGDTHHYSPVPDLKVTMLYEIVQAAIDEKVDFIFLCGDLVISGSGGPAEQDSALKDWRTVLYTLKDHNIKLFACRGNNDFSKEAWDSLFTGAYAFPQNGPENELNITYAFELNNILFISLDQYSENHPINQAWLDEQLAANEKPLMFVASHEPAFKLLHSNCMGAYPEARNICWESLIKAGVKIFFCGHDHFYDHAVIDDGDGSPNNDIHQVIVGTGGYLHEDANYDGDNGRWTPVRLFHEKANGYVLIEVNESEFKLNWKHRIAPNIFEDGGDSYRFTTSVEEAVSIARSFRLFQNYPNPFNLKTVISYQLPVGSSQLAVGSWVELSIYNLIGQKVATLVSEQQSAGNYTVEWDASALANGVYLYRLEAGAFSATRKLIILK